MPPSENSGVTDEVPSLSRLFLLAILWVAATMLATGLGYLNFRYTYPWDLMDGVEHAWLLDGILLAIPVGLGAGILQYLALRWTLPGRRWAPWIPLTAGAVMFIYFLWFVFSGLVEIPGFGNGGWAVCGAAGLVAGVPQAIFISRRLPRAGMWAWLAANTLAWAIAPPLYYIFDEWANPAWVAWLIKGTVVGILTAAALLLQVRRSVGLPAPDGEPIDRAHA